MRFWIVYILMMPLFGFSQDFVLIKDWQTIHLSSKYDNPITFEWKLERSPSAFSYLDNKYRYLIRFRSRTFYNGKKVPVYVSKKVFAKLGGENIYKSEFASTMNWDRLSTWDFFVKSSSVNLEIEVIRGRIGTFSKEIETAYDPDCTKLVSQLESYKRDYALGNAGDALSKASGVFDDDIAGFIAKYSGAASTLFRIYSSSVVMFLTPGNNSSSFSAYQSAHEAVIEKSSMLEKSLAGMEKVNSKTKAANELTEDFWNTPENPVTIPEVENKRKLIDDNITKLQEELKKEFEILELALKTIKIENAVGKDQDDCKYKGLFQYHESLKANINVLLSVKF